MDAQTTAVVTLLEVATWAKMSGMSLTSQSAIAPVLSHFLLFFITQYAVLKLYRIVIYPRFFSPLKNLPGPKDGFPLLGQFLQILTSNSPNEPFLTWSALWPRAPFIRFLRAGNHETLLINTPEAHREVFHTYYDSFEKPDFMFRWVGDITGWGLLFAEGEEHKRQRRLLQGLFTVRNLKRIFPVFSDKAEGFAQRLEDSMDEQGCATLDVASAYLMSRLNVTSVTIMGLELDQLTARDPEWDFVSCYRRIFHPERIAGMLILINAMVPIRRLLPVKAFSDHTRAMAEARAIVTECVRQRIRDVERAAEKGKKFQSVIGSGGSDLLTMLVEENQRQHQGSLDKLAEQELVDQTLTFVVGSHATTNSALVWASYILAKDQSIQDKLRSEILEARARKGCETLLWEAIDRLTYLNNFVREILRIYTPTVTSYRESTKDLNLCDTFVPKGTLFYFAMNVASCSKAVWGEDAGTCIPERWDSLHDEAADPYAFQTFSQGPRICIGKTFAMMNIKTFLVEMVHRFRFVKSPQMEALGGRAPELQCPTFTYVPKGSLEVVFERI
ncbi:cytochrome P450 [Podospora aff. communis PSN243]|uniref:Cytochrome P450 n=1 Tax=Podospora aff. communis PSN243 TaxID=3040156 RepID=A0AAV9GRE0_9PEZI|nr:cytochrome P450 [Podospora aff. communis PSN243]